jgi:hypothetical protein
VATETAEPTSPVPHATAPLAPYACWRLSRVVAKEDGPWAAVVRLRARAGTSEWGRLMDCPYCLSVWWAAPLAARVVRRHRLRLADAVPVWLAVSGGACALEAMTQAPDPLEVAWQAPAAPIEERRWP